MWAKVKFLLINFAAVEKFSEASPARFRKNIIAPFVVQDALKRTTEIAFNTAVLPPQGTRPLVVFRATSFQLVCLFTLINEQLNEGKETRSVMDGLKSLEQGVCGHTIFWSHPSFSVIPTLADTQ